MCGGWESSKMTQVWTLASSLPLTREQNTRRGPGMGDRCTVCNHLCLIWCLASAGVYLTGSVLGCLSFTCCRQEMDWVLSPKLPSVVAGCLMCCWSVFQNAPPSLLHWGLPSWSCIPFLLSCLKCSSPTCSCEAYFHVSEIISSNVTCLENCLSLGEQGPASSKSALVIALWCDGALSSCLCHNRWH